MKVKEFYVEHPKCLACPSGREYFGADELKKANAFAQSLANELGRPVSRKDTRGGESIFYPAFGTRKEA